MLFKRLIFLFFLFLSFVSKSEVVNKIDIIGLDKVSRGSVLSYLPIEVGEQINKDNLGEISNSLLKTNFFSTVEIDFSNQVLKLNVKENPSIKFMKMILF